MSSAPEGFAPLPNRVFADRRFRSTHFRVLGVIAAHDRFGRNGRGCTLSTRRIARKLGIDDGNVRRAIADLVSWGYLTKATHPSHAQSFTLALIYLGEDNLLLDREDRRSAAYHIEGKEQIRDRAAEPQRDRVAPPARGRRTVSSLLDRHLFVMAMAIDPRLTRMDVACGALLLELYNEEEGCAWLSYDTLASRMKVHRTNAMRSVARLVSEGYFERQRGGGRGNSNCYRPNFVKDDGCLSPKRALSDPGAIEHGSTEMQWIWAAPVGWTEKLVLIALAMNTCNDGCTVRLKASSIVKQTGLSERTIRRCLGALRAADMIAEIAPADAGKKLPPTYRLAMAVKSPPDGVAGHQTSDTRSRRAGAAAALLMSNPLADLVLPGGRRWVDCDLRALYEEQAALSDLLAARPSAGGHRIALAMCLWAVGVIGARGLDKARDIPPEEASRAYAECVTRIRGHLGTAPSPGPTTRY